jgi:hypothetical protein
MGIGAKKILDDRQIVMTLDHDVQNKSEKAPSHSLPAQLCDVFLNVIDGDRT